MKLPLKVDPKYPSAILDADGWYLFKVDRHANGAENSALAAEIVAAVNQRAEMAALLRRAHDAFGPGVWGYNNAAITAITAFLAKEPTP